MRNKSVTQHAFAMVPTIKKPRSVFKRNRAYKTTFDCDYLIPTLVSPVSPGDTIRVQHSMLVRLLSGALRPFMDNVRLKWFYFFVPYRLVWSNFQKFMGEQANPSDSISYTIPQCTGPNVAAGGITTGSLHDYLGLPTGPLSGGGGTTGITFNNLIPRSYSLIWNQWFRDENLQNSVTVDLGDGPDTFSNYTLQKINKTHDYFTSALPWLQKGTAVTLPLGTRANVLGIGKQSTVYPDAGVSVYESDGTSSTFTNASSIDNGSVDHNFFVEQNPANTNYPNVWADLSTATAATLNSLRQSVALQQFLENDARGGTRYTEIIKNRWGVNSLDQRLQRAEILSLGSSRLSLVPVANTAGIAGDTPQATLAAFGTSADVGNGFFKTFTEHGTVIQLIAVKADLTYSQGLDRHWSYRTRYDIYNPEFSMLGEQSILNKEVYANIPDGTGASQKDGVFGYIPRYDEERFSKSLLTGLLRPTATTGLNIWHLSEQFTSLPVLGSTFIQSNTPMDRVIAVPSEPHFILDAYYDETWARVMPMYSVPGLARL